MPTAPRRFCATPGCPERVASGHCPTHAAALTKSYASRYGESRLYGADWQRARLAFLGDQPYCAMCGRLANEVDHIVPHRGDRALFWNRNNWQSLCRTCHSKKTYDEVLGVR